MNQTKREALSKAATGVVAMARKLPAKTQEDAEAQALLICTVFVAYAATFSVDEAWAALKPASDALMDAARANGLEAPDFSRHALSPGANGLAAARSQFHRAMQRKEES